MSVRTQYESNGYVILRDFFDIERIQQVKRDAKRVFLEQLLHRGILASLEVDEDQFEQAMIRLFNEDLEAFVNCGKQTQWLPSLHALGTCAPLQKQLESLGVNFPCIGTRPVLYFNCRKLAKSEIYYKFPPHQDWRSMQGALNAVVVWAPLAEVPPELGPLQVVPGSHLEGLNPHIQDDYTRGVSEIEGIPEADYFVPELAPGDALFFSAFLVHRSGTNSTDSIRWSCHFRFNDLQEPTFVKRAFPDPFIYEPKQIVDYSKFPSASRVRETFNAPAAL